MTAEHTDRVLAVIAGDRRKLVQDPLLFVGQLDRQRSIIASANSAPVAIH